MKNISEFINEYKESLILKQLMREQKVPIVAFQNINEIEKFCKKYNFNLVWRDNFLINDYVKNN